VFQDLDWVEAGHPELLERASGCFAACQHEMCRSSYGRSEAAEAVCELSRKVRGGNVAFCERDGDGTELQRIASGSDRWMVVCGGGIEQKRVGEADQRDTGRLQGGQLSARLDAACSDYDQR
jgi:hypothetical protein